jgi:hypothetical protein
MKLQIIALFGEAEKGEFHVGIPCMSLHHLEDCFGQPPSGTFGLALAIQALLFRHQLIYFRVKEEGFSLADYLIGFKSPLIPTASAIAIPGVGDREVIEAVTPVLLTNRQVLIIRERDFYDWLY